jgi:hypothetical protein
VIEAVLLRGGPKDGYLVRVPVGTSIVPVLPEHDDEGEPADAYVRSDLVEAGSPVFVPA